MCYIIRVKIKYYEKVLSYFVQNNNAMVGSVMPLMSNKYVYFSIVDNKKEIETIQADLSFCKPKIANVSHFER